MQDKQGSAKDPTGDQHVAHTISWSGFGAFLTRIRQRRGVSQDTLAIKLGCGRNHI